MLSLFVTQGQVPSRHDQNYFHRSGSGTSKRFKGFTRPLARMGGVEIFVILLRRSNVEHIYSEQKYKKNGEKCFSLVPILNLSKCVTSPLILKSRDEIIKLFLVLKEKEDLVLPYTYQRQY